MGRSTSASICPNVAFIHKDLRINRALEAADENPLAPIDLEYSDDIYAFIPETYYTDEVDWHGWRLTQSFEYKELYGHKAEDGKGHFILIVNSAEYSNGGEESDVIFSEDRRSVEQFLKDFELDIPVEDVGAVQQTG